MLLTRGNSGGMRCVSGVMNVLDWIARVVTWVATLTMCVAIFGVSMFAFAQMLTNGPAQIKPATYANDTVSAQTALPELAANDFDIRRAVDFMGQRVEANEQTLASAPMPEAIVQPAAIETASLSGPSDVLGSDLRHVGGTAVNMRGGPSKDDVLIATLQPGDAVRVTGQNGSWVQVITATGATGWVSSRFLEGGMALTDTPAVAFPDDTQSASNDELDPFAFSDERDTRRSSRRSSVFSSDEDFVAVEPKKPASLSDPSGSPFWETD